MSINLVPEHALPKTFFLEEELSSRDRRIDSAPARTVRRNYPIGCRPPSRRSPQELVSRSTLKRPVLLEQARSRAGPSDPRRSQDSPRTPSPRRLQLCLDPHRLRYARAVRH